MKDCFRTSWHPCGLRTDGDALNGDALQHRHMPQHCLHTRQHPHAYVSDPLLT